MGSKRDRLFEETGGLRKRRVDESQTGDGDVLVQLHFEEGFMVNSIEEDRVWLDSAQADQLRVEESQRISRQAKEAQDKITTENNRLLVTALRAQEKEQAAHQAAAEKELRTKRVQELLRQEEAQKESTSTFLWSSSVPRDRGLGVRRLEICRRKIGTITLEIKFTSV
jgi:hypothetical protein